MNKIKDLKLGTKIRLGFGSILMLLIITIILGNVELNNIGSDFARYRGLANSDFLAGEIQSILLESRIAFENYVELGDESYSTSFNNDLSQIRMLIKNLENQNKNVNRHNKVIEILKCVDEYDRSFNEIVEYKKRRKVLYNSLSQLGPEMEKLINGIVQNAFVEKAEGVTYYASSTMRNLLLARLNAAKFLENNDFNSAELVKQEFLEMDKWINNLYNDLTHTMDKKNLNIFKIKKETYYNNFLDVADVIKERNKVVSYMDEIGPDISKLAEEIKISISNDKNNYENKVKSLIDNTVRLMIGIALIAIVFAILISIKIVDMVVNPVKTVTNTFMKISENEPNLTTRLDTSANDELGQMAIYFNKFMKKLEEILNQNMSQSWLKTGQSELNDKISGERDSNCLAHSAITYLCKYMNAYVGTFYIKDDYDVYNLIASYAYSRRKNLCQNIKSGEGIVGQAILEKQIIIVSNVPEDYIKISSSVGDAVPKYIVAVPCIFNDDVNCVLELGLFSDITDLQIEFLMIIGESIAVSINSSEARMKMTKLLEKSTTQAEELQVQQEELRQSNEELEEQAKALRESEAQLQSQQEELRVINEELEEHSKSLEIQRNDITEKNKHLTKAQKEIEEKAKQLELSNKYKSEFLANMSHELRTPLNSILVLSELLANKKPNEPLTEKQREFAKTINNSGSDLLKIINDILDISKVEAGKLIINPENMRISEIFDNLEKTFRQIAIMKNIKFDIVIDEDIPKFIVSDSQRVLQIVNNLLSNAFKFTEKGGIKITVGKPGSDIVVKNGSLEDYISISVIDTGIGISQEKQAIVFDPFMQSDGTTSRKYGGTGLGLSISRELTHLLGGSLHIKSEVGKGSVFSLLLPINNSVRVKSNSIENNVPKEEIEENISLTSISNENSREIQIAQENSNKKLLIIEDDTKFAELLSEFAKERGYYSDIADTGKKGIHKSIQDKPDAILLDIGLPDISGWEVIDIIKNNPITENIPIHIISGYENDNQDKKKNIDGIVGYFKKPVSINDIETSFSSIGKVLNKSIKNLLVIDQDINGWEIILSEIRSKGIYVKQVGSGTQAMEEMKKKNYDGLILELQLDDMSCYKFLSKIDKEKLECTSIIIYTDKNLTYEDELELNKYADSIIIKGNKSKERLIEELNLFLHKLDSKYGEKKKRHMKSSIEKENSIAGRKVLMIDDDMRNVFAIASVLEEKGMSVVIGRNGREGLEKLAEHSNVEIILMDIMMPEMDGYSAMRKIRKEYKYNNIPIIALTAKAMKEDKQKCIEAGASDYLTKPIDTEKLLSLLRVWLYK